MLFCSLQVVALQVHKGCRAAFFAEHLEQDFGLGAEALEECGSGLA